MKLKSEIVPYAGKMLENIIEGKEILKLRKGKKIFSQGDDADAVYFIQSGRVKVTIALSPAKKAELTVLGPGDFFGEGCLVGQPVRIQTVATTESTTVFKIQKRAMLESIHAQPELSEAFVASLLVRNVDVEEDICNQLFSRAEKRLAHALLKLDRYGRADFLPDAKLSQLGHGTLAEITGTTRRQILQFLNKFRRLGLIYDNGNGEIVVRAEMMADFVLAV